MRAVDTNVPRHEADQDIGINGAWVPHLVLAEAMWVLEVVYDVRPTEMATALEMFLSHKDLTLQESDVVAAALGHYRKTPSLGFSDCMVLEVARKAGHLPLGTFDRRLSKLDGVQRL